jgi:hypothetical protein
MFLPHLVRSSRGSSLSRRLSLASEANRTADADRTQTALPSDPERHR